jgi:hypothetical protein
LGLLLLLGGASTAARKDFVCLALVQGHVMLTWDVGGGEPSVPHNSGFGPTAVLITDNRDFILRQGHGPIPRICDNCVIVVWEDHNFIFIKRLSFSYGMTTIFVSDLKTQSLYPIKKKQSLYPI